MDNRSLPDVRTFDFLAGGGDLGALVRALDWSKTPLGPVESWPESLRTIVSVCLNSRSSILLWWGPELVEIYNDAYRPILGRTKHPRALGTPGKELWLEIWDIIGPMLAAVMERGESTQRTDQLLFLDRKGFLEETYFTYAYSPIRQESGTVGGVFSTVVETTPQVLGERRLRTLRDLAARSAGAENVAQVCQRQEIVLRQNPNDFAFILLYVLEEGDTLSLCLRVGELPFDLKPHRSSVAANPWNFAALTHKVAPLPSQYGPVFAPLWPADPVANAFVSPIRGSGDAPLLGYLVIGLSPRLEFDAAYRSFIDLVSAQMAAALTDARAYEAEKARAEALAEIDRAKTTFFSNVSHEFRTPLTLLLGPLEEALRKPSEGLHGEALDSAHRNALRLLRLVNSLLDFSRIEAGRAQAQYLPTDLSAATEELASVFRSAMERAGLRYSVTCNPLPESVFIDREMWEKIVLNLLSNAFKYTFEGEIRLEIRASDAGAELVVADTGTGIPPEALPQLFNRFYRVPGANGRTHEGSGIGLSLVRELVKLHGGSIDVESQVGQGSIFRVCIPFGTTHLPSDQVARTGTRRATESGAQAFVAEAQRWLPDLATGEQSGTFLALAHSEPPSASATEALDKPTVLLVDDNRDMREYVTRLLLSRFTVIAAQDGQHALDLLDTGIKPDLVLSDVMMPRLDGFGLLKALRARPLTATTPVIFLSARAGEEARIEGFDVGADDYLIKPFSARELITRIHTHVRLGRQRRELDQRKDIFLATLAHELRNPLAPIRNAAQMLGSPKLGPEQLQWAQNVIQRQVKHMAWLLDDLLDVARITQGKLDLKKQHITLNSVVDSALEAARPVLDSKSHQLTVTLPSESVTLDADPLRLSQVLSNLLTNAAKYTDAGGHITLSGRVENGTLSLSIKDDGIGIAPESISRIFAMFSQVEDAAVRSEGGLGIGLALVHGLTALHGGTVGARSEGLGRGSEFIVNLPIVTASTVTAPPADTAVTTSVGRRVLVADDNQDAADSLAMLLEMGGHDVRVVHDGRAALSVAQSFRPDAVLLDIGMPQLNGYEVARALRQEPWGARITLIALTGWGQERDRQRAIDAGFDRHLTKPIDPDTLEALLSDGAQRRAGSA